MKRLVLGDARQAGGVRVNTGHQFGDEKLHPVWEPKKVGAADKKPVKVGVSKRLLLFLPGSGTHEVLWVGLGLNVQAKV